MTISNLPINQPNGVVGLSSEGDGLVYVTTDNQIFWNGFAFSDGDVGGLNATRYITGNPYLDSNMVNVSNLTVPEHRPPVDTSLLFRNGYSSYVLMPALGQWLGSAGTWLFEAWVKAPAATSTDITIYAEQSTSSNTPYFTIGGTTVTGKKARVFWRNDANVTKANIYTFADVFDSTWHHIAVNAINYTLTVYVDGVADVSVTTDNSTTTLNRATIGCAFRSTTTYTYFLNGGQVTDVRAYENNKTQAGIIYDMLNASSETYTINDVVYEFAETSGTTAADKTGNGRTGTLVNNPVHRDCWVAPEMQLINYDAGVNGIAFAADYYFWQRSSAPDITNNQIQFLDGGTSEAICRFRRIGAWDWRLEVWQGGSGGGWVTK